MRSKALLTAAVLLAALVACGPAGSTRATDIARGTSGAAGLTGAHPCAGTPGFTCSMLSVPLDHSGRVAGTLGLQVATAGNASAPRGVLLFLTGGPGQPGVPSASRIASRLAPLFPDYRLVMFDQRGTGELGAIDCPALQATVGSSDAEAPPPSAVQECAGILGQHRRFYGTPDTVADMDMLRAALGARTMVVDGVSYGTYVAERYAIAHPDRVSKLVLDSVVPQADPHRTMAFYLTGLQATARVLRLACQTPPACGFDPARDVAWLVRNGIDGVHLFDMLYIYQFVDPTYRDPNPPGVPGGFGDVVGALHAARQGNPVHLDKLIAGLDQGGDPVASFSSGLHAATLCSDMRFPWGSDAVPVAARQGALDAAVARLTPGDTWPFDAATAKGMGFVQTCLYWPATMPAPQASARSPLPRIPVLLLAGDHDLSTPLEWARAEAAGTPLGQLVIVPGAAHSIQSRESGTQGRQAVYAFLLR
jgi:pimeloyl-ACP methyl ester carboxylesterase